MVEIQIINQRIVAGIILASTARLHPEFAWLPWHIPTLPQCDYFTVIVDLLRPVSPGGEVHLRSANNTVQPYISLNFFADDLDLVVLREGVRLDDIIMNGDGMNDLVGEDYPWPIPSICCRFQLHGTCPFSSDGMFLSGAPIS